MNGSRGVPFFWLRVKVGRRRGSVEVKLPPDWWWRRMCAKGECAYGGFMCPNGCPEPVFADLTEGESATEGGV